MKKCLSLLGVIFSFILMIPNPVGALDLPLGTASLLPLVELPERFWRLPPVTEEEEEDSDVVTLPEEVRRRLEEELRPRIPGIHDRLTDLFPLPDDDGDGVPEPVDPEPGLPPPPPAPPSDPVPPEDSGSPATGPASAPTPASPVDSFSDGNTVPLAQAEGGCSLPAMSQPASGNFLWMVAMFVGGTLVWRRLFS